MLRTIAGRVFALVLSLAAAPSSAAAERLRLASLEWAPYVGKDLPDQGYAAEVVRAACARRGVEVEIDFLPWSRALLMARRGEYDGLMPEYYDASREPEFVFSAPFPGGPVGLYQRRDAGIRYRADPALDLDAALRGLAGYRIGVVRGYLNNPVFDAADYLQKEEAVSDAVNLRKLFYKRVDLVFIDLRVAAHLLATELAPLAPGLARLEPAIEEKALYIAYARRAPGDVDAKRAACDEGFAELLRDGTLATIRAKHGFPAEAPVGAP